MTLLDDVLVLSGAGVGGGSLVYANTLLTPKPEVFQQQVGRDQEIGSKYFFLI